MPSGFSMGRNTSYANDIYVKAHDLAMELGGMEWAELVYDKFSAGNWWGRGKYGCYTRGKTPYN